LNDSDSKGNEHDDGKTATQILIKVIEENAVLLFKVQYSIAPAKVRIGSHSEIIAIGLQVVQ
jgi:hypothetical protein